MICLDKQPVVLAGRMYHMPLFGTLDVMTRDHWVMLFLTFPQVGLHT